MSFMERLAADAAFGWPRRLALPEHRQIELYTKRKALTFRAEESPSDLPLAAVAAVCRSALLMDAVVSGRHPGAPGRTSWQRYLDLPKASRTDKIAAELYRILRITHTVAFHHHGHVEMRDSIVRFNGAIDRVALSLEITVAGLDLLEAMTAYWLAAAESPYPEAYVEVVLAEFFFDVVAETKRFADEDRILYQFRRPKPFNRHFRFDCDNPKYEVAGDTLVFEIPPAHADPARYPIDFFLVHGQMLHIVPVEATREGRIAVSELSRWRARTPDALSLPAAFRPRFAREVMVVGQPMT
ncbi:hypothetical protein V5F53_08810 [Xanthobacter sp. V4C-4]|uniref:hypothetical protein n=1 Tax=Xanthobacter cornucopiae TaxID=3119924 RepID=UPI003726E130